MSIIEPGSPLEKARASDNLSDFDRRVANSLNNPMVHMTLIDAFKEYLIQYQALNQVPIPISQIIGFEGFTFQSAVEVNASETTASTSFTDLATVGPTITGLSDGYYFLIFGCTMVMSTNGFSQYMGISANGGAVDTNLSILSNNTDFLPGMRAYGQLLQNGGNNTLTAKYKVDGGTGTWQKRFLSVVKFANV